MHVAPEMPLAKRFSELLGERYYASDVDAARYKSLYTVIRPLDLCTDLVKLPSCCFDVIIHSHVLEHVKCDPAGVLTELERLLTPGGQHFLSVPVSGDDTREDMSDDLLPAQRLVLFGQEDHYRIFGRTSLPEMLDTVWGKREKHNLEPLELFDESELQRAAIPPEAWAGISSHSVFHHVRPQNRLVRIRVGNTQAKSPDELAATEAPSINGNASATARRQRPKLILHIGMPKAGTTSVQRWLSAQREAALKGGLDYWSIAENHSETMFMAFADERRVAKGTMWFQRDGVLPASEPAQLRASFDSFLSGLQNRTGFVSAEVLWTLAPADVKTLATHLRDRSIETAILCWIRPPAEFLRSAAQQRCRTTLSIGDFGLEFRTRVPIQFRRMDAWIEHFGRENMVVANLGQGVIGQLRDILLQFGITVDAPDDEERILNPSISLLAAKALLALNQTQKDARPGGREPSRRLRTILRDIQGGEFLLPESVLQRMRGVLGAEAEYLSERFAVDRDWLLGDTMGVDDSLFFQWEYSEVIRLLGAISDALAGLDDADDKRRSGGNAGI